MFKLSLYCAMRMGGKAEDLYEEFILCRLDSSLLDFDADVVGRLKFYALLLLSLRKRLCCGLQRTLFVDGFVITRLLQ